jgi:hypothetical protein
VSLAAETIRECPQTVAQEEPGVYIKLAKRNWAQSKTNKNYQNKNAYQTLTMD